MSIFCCGRSECCYGQRAFSDLLMCTRRRVIFRHHQVLKAAYSVLENIDIQGRGRMATFTMTLKQDQCVMQVALST